jgi:hypothetical protein
MVNPEEPEGLLLATEWFAIQKHRAAYRAAPVVVLHVSRASTHLRLRSDRLLNALLTIHPAAVAIAAIDAARSVGLIISDYGAC